MSKWRSKVAAIIEASRPQIWLFAVASAFCGMFMAVKGLPPVLLLVLVAVGVGPLMTAATNLLNAVFDIEVDKISKPDRPLPAGRINAASALAAAFLLYVGGLVIAFMIGIWPLIIALSGAILSILYSLPPIRIKAKAGFSNFALAMGYTTLGILGGWSIFRAPTEAPLFILSLMTLQVAGANVVKDFVDYEADKQLNIATLPVKYGVRKSIVFVSCVLLGVYLAIPFLYLAGSLEWTYLPISLFFLWGIMISTSMAHDFSRENRERAFHHAFFMSLLTEVAFTLAYVIA